MHQRATMHTQQVSNLSTYVFNNVYQDAFAICMPKIVVAGKNTITTIHADASTSAGERDE